MAIKITKGQLQAMLENIQGETEITVTVKGEAKMNKTNNPFYEKQGRAWVAKDNVEKNPN